MLSYVVAVLTTLTLGPCMFYLIGRRVAPGLRQFPLGLVDGVGDTVLLPLFNAVLVSSWQGFFVVPFMVSGLSGVFVGAVSMYVTVWYQEGDEWSRPSKGAWNVGTVYHACFTALQSALVVYGVWTAYTPVMLYLLGGFLVLFVVNALLFDVF